MKKLWILATASMLGFLMLLNTACRNDQLPDPIEQELCDTIDASYNQTVKAILDSKCATSGCHSGSVAPSLTNYTEVNAQTSRIEARALVQQTMPPASSTPLTNEELDILNCWKNAGFPE